MFKRILFLMFCITLFSVNVDAQRWWNHRRYHTHDVVIIEKTRKVDNNPKVIIINNNSNERVVNRHNDDKIYYSDNGDELYKIEYNDISRNEMIDVTEMWQQTIHFRVGQFRLDTSDFPTIENIALFMEKHPNVKIGLYGYSSKRRGSWDDNFTLAERRLESVCKALSQFGIDVSNRVELFVKGLRNHVYDEDSWNQCVVIKAIE